ncbi:MAG: flavin reductase [Phycisphaerales bacterium]
MDRLGNRLVSGTSEVLARIPNGAFVLTAAHEECRSGSLVRWVQQCADEPAMVVVAMRKGQPIEPLIRDSRAFCLNQLDSEEIFLRKKFEAAHPHGEDPFISLAVTTAPSGSPVLLRAAHYIDCELMRHLDIESDFEVYIGLVKEARPLRETGDAVRRVEYATRRGSAAGHAPRNVHGNGGHAALKRPA